MANNPAAAPRNAPSISSKLSIPVLAPQLVDGGVRLWFVIRAKPSQR